MSDGQLMTLLGLTLAAQTAMHVAVRRSTGALSRATRLSRFGLVSMLAGLGALLAFTQLPDPGGIELAPWQERLLVAGTAAIAAGLVLSLAALANASRAHVASRVSSMSRASPGALQLIRILGVAVVSVLAFALDALLDRNARTARDDETLRAVGYVPSLADSSEMGGVLYSDGSIDNGESMALGRTDD